MSHNVRKTDVQMGCINLVGYEESFAMLYIL